MSRVLDQGKYRDGDEDGHLVAIRVLVTTGEYRNGDVAVAPNGNKWERSDNDGLWFLSEPDGETSPLDDSIVSALGLQVYREEPEPPYWSARVHHDCTHGRWIGLDDWPVTLDGAVLIVPDTPENRARLTERRQ